MRARIDPSLLIDMSIAACPSMRPPSPRSTCRRASSTRQGVITARSMTVSSATIIKPPANSAATNCQPISTARMMPSSRTRLVEANWKAIAAMKSAPFRKIDRANATADDAAECSRNHDRAQRGIGQEAAHLALGYDRLNNARQGKAEDQRPQDFPSHRKSHREGCKERVRERGHSESSSARVIFAWVNASLPNGY